MCLSQVDHMFKPGQTPEHQTLTFAQKRLKAQSKLAKIILVQNLTFKLDQNLTLMFDQNLTFKMAKIGPEPRFTAHIICCGVIIWAKLGHFRVYYLGQVCFLLTRLSRNTRKVGFHHMLKKLHAPISRAIIILMLLGPDNNPYLGHRITPSKWYCLPFLLLNMC